MENKRSRQQDTRQILSPSREHFYATTITRIDKTFLIALVNGKSPRASACSFAGEHQPGRCVLFALTDQAIIRRYCGMPASGLKRCLPTCTNKTRSAYGHVRTIDRTDDWKTNTPNRATETHSRVKLNRIVSYHFNLSCLAHQPEKVAIRALCEREQQ